MSALQVQPLPHDEATSKPPLYVVPDLPETVSARATQSSARPSVSRSPKSAEGLADTSGVSVGRAVAYVTALALASGVAAGIGVIVQPSVDTANTRVASVQAGDSLWSIAGGLDITGRNIDEVVYDIRELNQLDSNTLTPGQTLVVPTK